ncbi:hypothetical protein BpHYR1_019099 [Brachionus plicatilis]|uniref:Uncharacterized protein n=1 Tax=Brachionus plicatilis TaxID=10195 RepID=A0A3M7SD21_BRAPC|nr:hypothetical protein BpHYR1_019099 [Brachionus plicatilis]
MTLKLIDKDLRSKYAEALFKNEASYDKEIERKMNRLNIDYFRSTQNIESGSQIFLNKVRHKRAKWGQDDMRFREHYKLVCRNVHNKKLDNLRQIFDSQTKAYKIKMLDPILQAKFSILEQQSMSEKKKAFSIFNTEIQPTNDSTSFADMEKQKNQSLSTIPKLPNIRNPNTTKEIDYDLYMKYSKSDRDFLEKSPGKIELTVTDVGKQYLSNEKKRKSTLRKQKIKYSRIQENAVQDSRYKNLITFLA